MISSIERVIGIDLEHDAFDSSRTLGNRQYPMSYLRISRIEFEPVHLLRTVRHQSG